MKACGFYEIDTKSVLYHGGKVQGGYGVEVGSSLRIYSTAYGRMMKDLIKEIFDNKMEKRRWNGADREIEEEIEELLRDEEEHLPPEAYEECRDKLYQAATVGKEKGFAEGFRYGVRLTAQCFIQKGDPEEP